ncbi:hypothetical protein LY78DRAFT_266450 [Colletotrichum sublineola]|nr:hypothetical protein LY78DRAFT_266450 [Colletotrichum sublineola]
MATRQDSTGRGGGGKHAITAKSMDVRGPAQQCPNPSQQRRKGVGHGDLAVEPCRRVASRTVSMSGVRFPVMPVKHHVQAKSAIIIVKTSKAECIEKSAKRNQRQLVPSPLFDVRPSSWYCPRKKEKRKHKLALCCSESSSIRYQSSDDL